MRQQKPKTNQNFSISKVAVSGMMIFALSVLVPVSPWLGTGVALAMDGQLATGDDETLTIRVANADDLVTAMVPDATRTKRVILEADVVLPAGVADAGGILMMGASDAPEVTLDLNGHNLSTDGAFALHVLRGSLNIVGNGVISAKTIPITVKGGYDPAVKEYAKVNIGPGVTLRSPAYGLAMMHTGGGYNTAYGTQVNFEGKIDAEYAIYINGSVKNVENPLKVKIGDGAVVLGRDTAIYAAGYAEWQIGQVEITGDLGIGIKAGKMNLNGTTVTATGDIDDPEVTGGGMDSTGVTFQIEHHKSYVDQMSLVLNGGKYTSDYGDVFYEYGAVEGETGQKLAKIDVKSGEFVAGEGRKVFGGTLGARDVLVQGGRFQGEDVADFGKSGILADGLIVNASGTVMKKPIIPSNPKTPITEGKFSDQATGVTVEGTFLGEGVKIESKVHHQPIVALADKRYVAFEISMINLAGKKVQPDGSVKVMINVPKGLKGEKLNVYYINEVGELEKLKSAYENGKISFETTHFSLYALVEDKGVEANKVQGTVGSTPDTGVLMSGEGDFARELKLTAYTLMIVGGLAMVYLGLKYYALEQKARREVTIIINGEQK